VSQFPPWGRSFMVGFGRRPFQCGLRPSLCRKGLPMRGFLLFVIAIAITAVLVSGYRGCDWNGGLGAWTRCVLVGRWG
jgi:hypothetical protein